MATRPDTGPLLGNRIAVTPAGELWVRDDEGNWLKLARLLEDGTLNQAQIPDEIARDSEVTAAVTAHVEAADPHGDRNYTDEQIAALSTVFEGASDELSAIGALPSAANTFPYFTGVGSAALADLSAFARTLLDDADQAAMRTTLGLRPGTEVQAWDAELAALAGLTSAANKFPYFTGSGAAALADLTAYARTVLALASAAALNATLGGFSTLWAPTAGDWIDLSGQVGGGTNNATLHSSTANTDGAAVYVPFTVDASWRPIDALQIDVRTAAGAGNVRLGIHSDNDAEPGSVVVDASTASATSPGLKTLTFSPLLPPPGRYFAVVVFQGITGTNPTVTTINSGRAAAPDTAPVTGANSIPYYRTATGAVLGALAANPAPGVVRSSAPLVPVIRARFA